MTFPALSFLQFRPRLLAWAPIYSRQGFFAARAMGDLQDAVQNVSKDERFQSRTDIEDMMCTSRIE